MTSIGVIALCVGSIGIYVWLCMKKAGIGQSGGKPDCGCGTGSSCKTKKETPSHD